MAIVLSVIIYCCFGGLVESIESGFYLIIFLFLAVGCLIFPAGPFEHPHPIIYRLIFGISLLYAFFLLMLLSQSPDNARGLLGKIFNDEELGKPLKTRNYATDCSISYEVLSSMVDRFILAHFLGWMVKALIIRDRLILWILSVLWELIELSTAFFIPNFAECWWDQWILDVTLCNAFGIEFGLWITRKYFSHPERNWLGKEKKIFSFNNMCLKVKRLAIQFTPTSITPMQWSPFKDIKRYYQIHLLILCGTLIDFNSFILKLFLFIPTEHILNLYRLIIMCPFFVISCKQYYLFLTNKKCKKMGSQTWVGFVILVLEIALCIKCRPRPFPKVPYENIICWIIGSISYLLFTYVYFRDVSKVKVN